MAWSGGSSYQAGECGILALCRFAVHGSRRVHGVLDIPDVVEGHEVCVQRSRGEKASHCMGDPGWSHLGSGQYVDCLCYSRCWSRSGVSVVEYEHTDRTAVGMATVQRVEGR